MEEATFNCLYCGSDKPTSESSLEHAVPQFLGGDAAPIQYLLRNVCKTCNNRLGLFVDASYAKSWFVTNGLASASRTLYTGPSDQPIPLSCIGHLCIEGLSVPEDHVVEHWIGPSGETVVWIRNHDDRVFWYSGGNPIESKKKNSVAYLNLTSADPVRYQMGIESFQEAFKKKKVRKILCAELLGAPEGYILPGFDARNPEDETNVLAIRQALKTGKLTARISVNTKFDLRFISKMVLGIGYSLFGAPYLATSIAQEARKGCWPKEGEPSELRGSASLITETNSTFSKIVGYPAAVALMIMRSGSSYVMTLTVDQKMPFTVELAPITLTSGHINSELGYVLLLFPHLKQAVELTLVDLLAHSTGAKTHPALEQIDTRRRLASAFHEQLAPMQPADAIAR